MSFKIGTREIGTGKLFFVVEEGQANLGDFAKALAMIDAAAEAQADAIEFQLARADDFYVKGHANYQVYVKREFTASQLNSLVSYSQGKKIEFLATPLSHKLIEPLAKAGCSGFNINASDLTNPDVIDGVLDSGLPFFLSLPLAREEELSWAVQRIRKKARGGYAFLHGQHTMASGDQGVAVEHTSLGYVATLKERYEVPVGFIDHTPLVWFPAAAVAGGADIVTKHLALSRREQGPDWHICLEPDEMKQAVSWARKMKESIKVEVKKLAPGEDIDRSAMRRSIVAARKLASGKIIERQDLVFKRPGTGLCPSRAEELLGKTVIAAVGPDQQIKLSDIK